MKAGVEGSGETYNFVNVGFDCSKCHSNVVAFHCEVAKRHFFDKRVQIVRPGFLGLNQVQVHGFKRKYRRVPEFEVLLRLSWHAREPQLRNNSLRLDAHSGGPVGVAPEAVVVNEPI